jgi:hypothetical protein
VSDSLQPVTWVTEVGNELRERLAAYENPSDFEDPPAAAEPSAGLVSLGFIWAALRRSTRLWCALAIVGLVIGAGYSVSHRPAKIATTSLLLVNNPATDQTSAAQTDIALAQSIPVATAVVRQLGLQQTPTGFLKTYSVVSLTPQVLVIVASGVSSSEAMQTASAVSTQFLNFLAQYEQTQQQQTDTQLAQQVNQAEQNLASINAKISKLSSQSTSSGDQSQLSSLQAQRKTATDTLAQVQQYATSTKASTQTVTQQMIKGSQVLSPPTPVARSLTKGLLTYGLGGLIGGLFLGLAIVAIGAITSDKLRRRDDIAYAFGAPVKLSVGPLHTSRIPELRRGRQNSRRRDLKRMVEHLRRSAPGPSQGPVGLAVVALDDAPTVAQVMVALLDSVATRGPVVLADLSVGAQAARLLGVTNPGVSMLDRAGARVAVVVPTAGDVAPIGPFRNHVAPDKHPQPDEEVAAVCRRAHLVLTLVTLDPSYGGDYLVTWAADAVAVVTAGRSTATRIHASGEMLRLAGLHLNSVVVMNADKSDESLGATIPEHRTAPAAAGLSSRV